MSILDKNYFSEIKKIANDIRSGYLILKDLKEEFEKEFNNEVKCEVTHSTKKFPKYMDSDKILYTYHLYFYHILKSKPFINLEEIYQNNPYPLIFNGYGLDDKSFDIKILNNKIINDDKELIEYIKDYLNQDHTKNYISFLLKLNNQ